MDYSRTVHVDGDFARTWLPYAKHWPSRAPGS
ncbi:hypothetical protein SSPS47_00225 [Streptomyces sp. S4.7]|nr:hypothetical protein SSPS47_00225 [Streptomyces sp. S4.7]